MPQLNVILDEETAATVRESSKKLGVSISHHLNNLIQRGLMVESQAQENNPLLTQQKTMQVLKKLLTFNTETLALVKYLVSNMGDGTREKDNQHMLEKAMAHAESYAGGVFES